MRSNTDWFKEAQWGVFTHYLDSPASSTQASSTSADEWNRRIDSFDANRLARQLESVDAKYYFITLGQNSGHYCSPNAAYDSYVGRQPSLCSQRDLIAELADALSPRGIALMTYLPSGAPDCDGLAMEKLGWRKGDYRLAAFQTKWEAVIREWSVRWGKKVAGWWIDGCYFADSMYRHAEPPNFASLAAALRAGNPESILAFNPGVKVPVVSLTEDEDYTAGEMDYAFPVGRYPPGSDAPTGADRRAVGGAQYHLLSFLGRFWGQGAPRFSDEFVIGYTKDVNVRGGVVTWDVPISSDGLIHEPFLAQLRALRDATR